MLEPLLPAFSEYLHSSQFRDLARHPDFPNAFTRARKLPLHALLAVVLSGMRKGIQAELDEFFAHLEQRAQLVRHVSERAFFSARAKLGAAAIPALNAWLVGQADASGFVPRRQGLWLAAASTEHVSGLSQRAALHDFAAKILCDNLQAVATETAHRGAALSPTRRINRTAAHSILKPLLPTLLLGVDVATRLFDALQLIARQNPSPGSCGQSRTNR